MTNHIRTDDQSVREIQWARMRELTIEAANLTHKVRLARSFMARFPDAPGAYEKWKAVSSILSSLQSELIELQTALSGQDNFEW